MNRDSGVLKNKVVSLVAALLAGALVLLTLGALLTGRASAEEAPAPVVTNAAGNQADGPEKGWFWQYWYQLQAEREAREKARQAAEKEKEARKEDPCMKAGTWKASCGFVDPAGDFAWQSEQRDALRQEAVMYPNDPNKVKATQQYQAWVIKQAFTMVQMWEWNKVQDQNLNSSMTNPVAGFAILALLDAKDKQRLDVMGQIKKQGGFLLFFSRSTCDACEQAAGVIQGVSRWTGVPVYEASLDGKCHAGFAGDNCRAGAKIVQAAEQLGVTWVPDIWLYLGEQDVWIRVSSGMESQSTIVDRIEMFFQGVVQAVAKGIQAAKGQNAPVDFDFSPTLESRGMLGKGVSNASGK